MAPKCMQCCGWWFRFWKMVGNVDRRSFIFVLVVVVLTVLVYRNISPRQPRLKGRHEILVRKKQNESSWVFKDGDSFHTFPVTEKKPLSAIISKVTQKVISNSPFIIQENKTLGGFGSSFRNTMIKTQEMKYISIYDPKIYYSGIMRRDFRSCDVKSCQMTRDFRKADAVIFIMPKLKSEPYFRRRNNQVWILYTVEAPSRSNYFSLLSHTVYRLGMNLSITFRLDSDIPNVYGKLVKKQIESGEKKDYRAIFRKKSKMAAWFVSHCKTRSRRMKYVTQMKTRIDVDIMGQCGVRSCGNFNISTVNKSVRESLDSRKCLPMLSDEYKFYLAFENTLCKDYVTEKFFKIFRDVNIIPVVRGGADYKSFFPSDMYIDADDFSTPESLADFLFDLANDEERYIRYLKNKDQYRFQEDKYFWSCELCAKLHSGAAMRQDDMYYWWTHDSCHDPVDSMRYWKP